MPRRRLRPRFRRPDLLSDRTIIRLLSGYDWEFLDDYQPALTAEELKEAWELFGEEIVKVHVFGNDVEDTLRVEKLRGYHCPPQPGTRPWGWWQFEADGLPEIRPDEEEAAYLHRAGVVGREEYERSLRHVRRRDHLPDYHPDHRHEPTPLRQTEFSLRRENLNSPK
jgi:hypothetical protein